jgi:nitrogen fixation-related uncharacterized protein
MRRFRSRYFRRSPLHCTALPDWAVGRWALIPIRQNLRPNAITVVHALGARGLGLIVLSGNRPQAVGPVARSVAGFLWTVKSRQSDDLNGAALRILPDDDVAGTQ